MLSFLFEDKKQSVIYSLSKHRVHCQSPKEIHAKNNNIWKAFLWPYTATKWNSIACIHNPPLCMSCCYQVPHLQTPMREIGLVFSVKMVRTRILQTRAKQTLIYFSAGLLTQWHYHVVHHVIVWSIFEYQELGISSLKAWTKVLITGPRTTSSVRYQTWQEKPELYISLRLAPKGFNVEMKLYF